MCLASSAGGTNATADQFTANIQKANANQTNNRSFVSLQAFLGQKQYADVYGVLQQAVNNDTKLFVQDLKADGLHANSPDAVDIVYECVVNTTMFDGEPSKHKLTTAQYGERFTAADA